MGGEKWIRVGKRTFYTGAQGPVDLLFGKDGEKEKELG